MQFSRWRFYSRHLSEAEILEELAKMQKEEKIEVGDWVRVVRPCLDQDLIVGSIHRVSTCAGNILALENRHIWFNQDNALLSNVVKKLKGNITKRYHDIMKFPNQVYVPLWQRSFYEHIIRDDKDYERIAEYIQNNPLQWQLDRFYIP